MKRGILVLIVAGVLVSVFIIRVEIAHGLHYLLVKKDGQLKAQFVQLELPHQGVAGETLPCHIAIKNTGSKKWTLGENYFALGVFERSSGKRVEDRILFSNETNRIIVPEEGVAPGETWRIDCAVVVRPQPDHITLHFGMVQEGVTWFYFDEKSVRVSIVEAIPDQN